MCLFDVIICNQPLHSDLIDINLKLRNQTHQFHMLGHFMNLKFKSSLK